MTNVFVRYGFPFIDEPNDRNIDGMIQTTDSVISLVTEKTKIIPWPAICKHDLVDHNNI
jgi:hypothetical protein